MKTTIYYILLGVAFLALICGVLALCEVSPFVSIGNVAYGYITNALLLTAAVVIVKALKLGDDDIRPPGTS